ncbi:hypothetical protein [Clostridium beijerinckii]|uniref:hypothetical protein n=1 Tax=Clostridium beijerinckii TaxID=1520 RepID=UPI00047E5AA8|nr:hypothetical protein [Clostridium beijerinckii]
MIKVRKVGTLTSGLALIVFGIMFLLRVFITNLNVLLIVSMWPLILVSVGIEIIAACIINNQERMQYDFSAIILVIILVFFAMGMGGAEFIVTHSPQFRGTI